MTRAGMAHPTRHRLEPGPNNLKENLVTVENLKKTKQTKYQHYFNVECLFGESLAARCAFLSIRVD